MFLHLWGMFNLKVPFSFFVFTLKNVNGLNQVCDGCLNRPHCRQFLIYELRADYVTSSLSFFKLPKFWTTADYYTIIRGWEGIRDYGWRFGGDIKENYSFKCFCRFLSPKWSHYSFPQIIRNVQVCLVPLSHQDHYLAETA